jgi:hypothetical protein
LRDECERYQKQIQQERHECDTLENLHSRLKEDVDSCNQTLALYAKLFDMGFGLKELKLLWHIICEIAYANNIPREDAVRKFFKDVEEYDDKLGFESKVRSMQEELNHLDQKKTKLLTEINVIPQLALALGKLLSVGDNNSIEDIKLLVDQIRRAGGIKEATDKLTSQSTTCDHKPSALLSKNTNYNSNPDDVKTKTTNMEELAKARAQSKDDKDSNYNEYPDKYKIVVPDMHLPRNFALPIRDEKEEKPKTRSGLEEKENEKTAEQQIEEFIKGFKLFHESP